MCVKARMSSCTAGPGHILTLLSFKQSLDLAAMIFIGTLITLNTNRSSLNLVFFFKGWLRLVSTKGLQSQENVIGFLDIEKDSFK